MTAPKYVNDPTAGHVKPIEAARLLHVSLRSIMRWLVEGRFPGAWQTSGGRWWIPDADVEGWRIAPDWLMAKAPEPVVYFIRAGKRGAIKIGFTRLKPESRVQALQVASPQPLRLLGVTPGSQQLEAELHERFSAARLHGEWFSPTKELLQFIASCSTKNYDMANDDNDDSDTTP